jgi:hypothetical protein
LGCVEHLINGLLFDFVTRLDGNVW